VVAADVESVDVVAVASLAEVDTADDAGVVGAGDTRDGRSAGLSKVDALMSKYNFPVPASSLAALM
jgi:hypothetical protein